MTHVTFSTTGFTCPSCVKKIEKTVGRLAGVDDVAVMFNANKVRVTFDETAQQADTIARTIADLGYPVTATSRPVAV
ncbi:heavy metal-binding protein [Microbacterium protaetiae]|uniref:Heavy metal-binding protein n=1 Tax=Microbacterium protaetiae TaxID=2509458 RepID=A0A4V0YDD7_9MICO|nr:copper ion binding protein [Microbacterium protaetiae]QAY60351.1 heavy metal-binding protein [Microbacterium protaetiae]